MPAIDITLVSGRRPELLARTLASFGERLFSHFPIANLFANIDPFGGSPREGEACRELILKAFPRAQIHMPASACFGLAVQSLWAKSRSGVIFHLEDDWVALSDIRPEMVFSKLEGATKALKLVAKPYRFGPPQSFQKRPIKLFNITVAHGRDNVFSTSPSFYDGAFARHCAGLMRPELDPEKQMHPAINPALHGYMNHFRCGRVSGTRQNHHQLIADIGREWRADRGIVKAVEAGKSIWTADAGGMA